jgi:iron complex transport system substrate-binding protein
MPALTAARRRWLRGAAALAAATALGRLHAAPARRIVSIGGALTETLYALGAQDELVGVDTTSLYPAAARTLPSVGYARALSAEGVLSLRPTLVVAAQEAGPPAVVRQLAAAGMQLQVLDAGLRFAGVLERTQRLAELVGRADAGRALVDRLATDWAAAQARVARHRARAAAAPRVLFVLSHAVGQVRVSGRGTAADAMLRYAGAANALDGVDGYVALTPEAAIAAAPGLLLTTDQGLEAAGGVDGLLRLPGLARTPAGAAGRVVAQDALALLGFGPRMPQALHTLADALYGASS